MSKKIVWAGILLCAVLLIGRIWPSITCRPSVVNGIPTICDADWMVLVPRILGWYGIGWGIGTFVWGFIGKRSFKKIVVGSVLFVIGLALYLFSLALAWPQVPLFPL
jgi:hypothetical protein